MRIVKFIGLKIIEVGGGLLLLYLCALYFDWINPLMIGNNPKLALEYAEMYWMLKDFIGLCLLLFPIIVLVAIIIYYLL
jgi:hypothetical protein